MIEVANWIVAIPLLTIFIIKLFWGLDLITTEIVDAEWRWRVLIRSGSFYLGIYFLITTFFLFGVLGIFLLMDPKGTTPAWFGIAMVAAAVTSILSWWWLTFEILKESDQ